MYNFCFVGLRLVLAQIQRYCFVQNWRLFGGVEWKKRMVEIAEVVEKELKLFWPVSAPDRVGFSAVGREI